MYEQQSLEQKAPVETPENPELFEHYEIRPWEFSPRIYKILGASVLANLLFLTVISQTSVLTMRGCQSPFVGNVCTVLDMAYLGTVLFGTDREFVDMAYERTDLGEAEITWVNMDRSEPRFEYPPGYFQLANPEQFQAESLGGFDNSYSGFPPMAPGIPSNPTINNDLASRPQRLPKSNPNPVKGKVTSPWGDDSENEDEGGENPTLSENNGSKNANTNAKPSGTPVPADTVKPLDAVTINREPMRVFGKEVAEKIDKREVDISQNFKVTAIAVLDPSGKMDVTVDKKTKLQKSRILSAEGDEKMIQVVSQAIAAVGDSGWLGYLRLEGIEKLNFTFSQTDDQLLVDITSDQISPERARAVSSKLANALSAALLGERSGMLKLGDDEKALLQAATATANGKTVVVNFKLPKPVAQEMIIRNVNRARESEAGKKSNSGIEEPGTTRGDTSAK
jgi:hypothetical protein